MTKKDENNENGLKTLKIFNCILKISVFLSRDIENFSLRRPMFK